METNAPINLKRKCVSPSQDSGTKSSKLNIIETPPEICDLSDCILLQILQYLDATSLYQLGRTCSRFQNLVLDHSLWTHVEGRFEPNSQSKIKFCWENVGAKTRSLKLSGQSRSRAQLLNKLLDPLKLNCLTVLALEHQCIKYCRLNEFPNTLEEISFRHSYVPKHSIFFRFSEKQMCNLRVLVLDHCEWFEANSFTSLCKYPKLEILSLYMCKKLSEDEIANVSLAGRVGFSSLKVADLRFTGLGEVFIRSFYSSPSIQIIYFQCYGTTYATDRYKRKLDIISGAKMKDHSYLSDDEENSTDSEWLRRRFNAKRTQKYETQTIKDNTMAVYKQVKKVPVDPGRPHSVLYVYPYDRCTCGCFSKGEAAKSHFRNNNKVQWDVDGIRRKLEDEVVKQRENRADMKGGQIYFMLPNNSTLCNKIAFDSCMMPEWCSIEASPSAPIHKWLYIRVPKCDYEVAMLEHVDKHYLTYTRRKCNFLRNCDCSSAPLRGNAIRLKPLQEVGQWPGVGEQNFSYYYAQLANNQYENVPVLSNVIKYMTNIKTSDDTELEALSASRLIVRLILDSENCDSSEILDDQDFIEKISQLIHTFATRVEFDIFHVVAYHCCCFDDLCRHIRSNCDVKECITYFFTKLLNNVLDDFSDKTSEPELSKLQFEREEEEHDLFSESNHQADPNSFESFASMQRLETRRIVIQPHRREEMQRLPMQNVNVVNQNVMPKKYTTTLKELSLRGYTHVTDLTLMILKDLDLVLLDVTGTNITAEGAQQFMTYNPHCWFIHETTCVCRPNLHF